MNQLAKTFDRNASRYRKFRPDYPSCIADDIIWVTGISAGCQILEIGCGAGQATKLFTRLNPVQTCIDPGRNLLAECKDSCAGVPGYSFVCSTFEDFPADSPFDLIYAATCFHWITKGVRFSKAAQFLKAGGHLAIFTDRHTKGTEGFFLEAQSIYSTVAPELDRKPPEVPDDGDTEGSSFSLVFESDYDRDISYSSQEYIGLLSTFSGHSALGQKRLNMLCKQLQDLIEKQYGGNITKTLTTKLKIYKNVQPS